MAEQRADIEIKTIAFTLATTIQRVKELEEIVYHIGWQARRGRFLTSAGQQIVEQWLDDKRWTIGA